MKVTIRELQVGGYPADLVVLDAISIQDLANLDEVLPRPRPGRGIVFEAELPIWAAMACSHHCHRLTWLGVKDGGKVIVVEAHVEHPQPGDILTV